MQRRSLAPIPLAAALFLAVTAVGHLLYLLQGLRYLPSLMIFLCLLGFGVYTFFAVILFFQRRDIMLPIAAGSLCLLCLVDLMGSFQSVWSFLGAILFLLAAIGVFLAAAAAVLPPFYQYHPWTEKFWFLPGLAAALGGFLTIAAYPYLLDLLRNLASIAAYFLLTMTIVFPDGIPYRPCRPLGEDGEEPPYEGPQDFYLEDTQGEPYEAVSPAQAPEKEPWDGTCDILKHVLLLLFTFGVWFFMWIYRTTAYLNRVEDQPPRTPVNQLLLCLFVPFYQVYWAYKSAQRLDRLANGMGIRCDLQVACLVLALFVPILPPILMQDKMNALVPHEPAPWERPYVPGAGPHTAPQDPLRQEDLADHLRAYKALLEEGLITQADYDAKKMQILGL